MKKNLFRLVLVGVLVSTVGFVAVSQAATKPKTTAKPAVVSTVNSTWVKVLDGKVTANYGNLDLSTTMSWAQVHSYLWNGQDFKVALNSAMGGGSGSESYTCADVSLEDGDNVFHCYSASTTSKNKPTFNLRFDTDGNVAYISATPGQADGVQEVRVFIKK